MGLDDQTDPPRWIFALAFTLLALFAVTAAAIALSSDGPAVQPAAAIIESDRPTLVVFETDSCIWCRRFRQNVAPAYEQSRLDRLAPLRYVDLAEQKRAGYRLNGRVTATPTFVLVDKLGSEVDRLRGLPGGREEFMVLVEKMIDRIPDARR